MRKSGLPPVIDENTEILILGTLPSDKSLAAQQYYANPKALTAKGYSSQVRRNRQDRTTYDPSFDLDAISLYHVEHKSKSAMGLQWH